MPYHTPSSTLFTQDGAKASYIPVADGQTVTVSNSGATLYYDNASSVTSSSNDGNIATAASATFTSPQWVICATGAATQVHIKGHESFAGTGPVTGSNQLSAAAAPTSGTTGTGQGVAPAGGQYTNTATGVVYVNEGTTASPYWTPISFSQPGLVAVQSDFRELPPTTVAGTNTSDIMVRSGLRSFGLGAAETDAGVVPNASGLGINSVRLTTDNVDGKVAALGTQVDLFDPTLNGPIVLDVEIANVTDLATKAVFVGFTNAAAATTGPLMTYATTVATYLQDDICGVTWSSELTQADDWFKVAETNNLGGTVTVTTSGETGVDPAAAAAWQRVRIEVSAAGVARAFFDKVDVGLIWGATGAGTSAITTAAVDPTEELCALVYIETTTTTAMELDVRQFAAWGNRVA